LGGLLIGATRALEPIDARRFQLQLREPFGFVLDALAKPGTMVPMIMPRRLAETPASRRCAAEDHTLAFCTRAAKRPPSRVM
jgi:peptide/nickel transport system substrate-binding protein